MFFVLSKVLTFFCMPSNLVGLLGLGGIVLLVAGRIRSGIAALVGGILAFAAIGWLPLGDWALATLENRFPPYVDDGKPVAGVIVLGGSIDTQASSARSAIVLNDSAERLTEAVALARRHPEMHVIFTGGEGSLFGGATTEAAIASRFFDEMGISSDRVSLEGQSRTTAENAERVKAMVAPAPGERWLLVTSGYHMPRAMGTFRAAGLDLVAYPVDYRVGDRDLSAPHAVLSEGLQKFDLAAREWVGLAAYRFTGRGSALFPAP